MAINNDHLQWPSTMTINNGHQQWPSTTAINNDYQQWPSGLLHINSKHISPSLTSLFLLSDQFFPWLWTTFLATLMVVWHNFLRQSSFQPIIILGEYAIAGGGEGGEQNKNTKIEYLNSERKTTTLTRSWPNSWNVFRGPFRKKSDNFSHRLCAPPFQIFSYSSGYECSPSAPTARSVGYFRITSW